MLTARLKVLVPAIGVLVVGVILAFAAASRTELACSRNTGACTYYAKRAFSSSAFTFRTSEVRDVRFVGNQGKGGRRGEVHLVFTRGDELAVARGDAAELQDFYEDTRAFFSASGTAPNWGHTTSAGPWTRYLAIACFAGALVLGVLGFRKRIAAPPALPALPKAQARTVGEQTARRQLIRNIAIGIGALAVISAAFFLLANRGKGTLVLQCEARCRFQGGECLPGGRVQMALEPGAYTIDVWAASGSALWTPQTFRIAEDTTTTFVCRQ